MELAFLAKAAAFCNWAKVFRATATLLVGMLGSGTLAPVLDSNLKVAARFDAGSPMIFEK